MRSWVFVAALLSVSYFAEGSARACGAVVTDEKSVVVQAQQRVLISLRADGSSKIVVQLGIPEASAPFGAITPVGGPPTPAAAAADRPTQQVTARAWVTAA